MTDTIVEASAIPSAHQTQQIPSSQRTPSWFWTNWILATPESDCYFPNTWSYVLPAACNAILLCCPKPVIPQDTAHVHCLQEASSESLTHSLVPLTTLAYISYHSLSMALSYGQLDLLIMPE